MVEGSRCANVARVQSHANARSMRGRRTSHRMVLAWVFSPYAATVAVLCVVVVVVVVVVANVTAITVVVGSGSVVVVCSVGDDAARGGIGRVFRRVSGVDIVVTVEGISVQIPWMLLLVVVLMLMGVMRMLMVLVPCCVVAGRKVVGREVLPAICWHFGLEVVHRQRKRGCQDIDVRHRRL